jgi:hypothetical protein
MPTWHTAHFKSITVPSGKKGTELAKGDKLAVSLNSLPLNFSPTIVVRNLDLRPSLPPFPTNCPFAPNLPTPVPFGPRPNYPKET